MARETTWDYIKAIENRRSSLKLSKGFEALVNRAVGAVASLMESVKKSGSGGPSVKPWVPTAEDVLKIVVKDFGPCL